MKTYKIRTFGHLQNLMDMYNTSLYFFKLARLSANTYEVTVILNHGFSRNNFNVLQFREFKKHIELFEASQKGQSFLLYLSYIAEQSDKAIKKKISELVFYRA